jgi:hypothetical protein
MRLNRMRNVTIGLMVSLTRPDSVDYAAQRRASLGFGIAHLSERAVCGRAVDQDVTLTTLDAVASDRKLSRLDFIEADTEGWERRAIVSGRAAPRRFKPALFLEMDWSGKAPNRGAGVLAREHSI